LNSSLQRYEAVCLGEYLPIYMVSHLRTRNLNLAQYLVSFITFSSNPATNFRTITFFHLVNTAVKSHKIYTNLAVPWICLPAFLWFFLGATQKPDVLASHSFSVTCLTNCNRLSAETKLFPLTACRYSFTDLQNKMSQAEISDFSVFMVRVVNHSRRVRTA
jgi:hypothetical protein